jgi:cytoskeletal protein RodZ
MKRTTSIIVALLLVGTLIVAAGCGSSTAAPAPTDPSQTTDQTQTPSTDTTTPGTDTTTPGTDTTTPGTDTAPSSDGTQVSPQGGSIQ